MDYDPDLEARVVRLETAMESVQSDVREIKTDLRAFRAEVKEEFAAVRKQFDEKFEAFRKEFNDRLEANRREARSDLFKFAGIFTSVLLGMTGMMARGFGWL